MRLNSKADRAAYRAAMIPSGAERDPRSSELGEAFKYEAGGKPYAIAFWGSAGRPLFHNWFRKPEDRDRKLGEFFASLESSAKTKAERAASKAAFKHSLVVGDVLRCSWGYDQTNVEFFEVIRPVGEKKVEIRPIAVEAVPGTAGFMCEYVKPIPGKYCGGSMEKLVLEGNRVSIHSFASAYKCSPNESSYSSWYA